MKFLKPVSFLLLLSLTILYSCSYEVLDPSEFDTDPTPPLKENLLDKNQMLDAVNAWRQRGCLCGTDSFPPVAKLKWNKKLEHAALRHSQDMAAHDFVSHTGSDSTSSDDRVTAAGYSFAGWTGENIAAYTRRETEVEVVRRLIESPGHCRAIMREGFTEFGSALYSNPDAEYVDFWTQVFATPAD